MATTQCNTCGGTYSWDWTEAFDKFGFNDGDGQVETYQVEAVLTEAGYEVELSEWGLHNTVISSIEKDGAELIPATAGYDDPREYLPKRIIRLLDKHLS